MTHWTFRSGPALTIVAAGFALLWRPAVADAQGSPNVDARTGAELYATACAACHGGDGTGLPQVQLGFDLPVADFTDCSFATREPDSDWFAVTHDGGPARGFDRLMPAFGDALTDAQIEAILLHVRGFCEDDDWPRGELNFPRAMFTEKAYVEDEAVWTVDVAAEGPGDVTNEFVYENRFGARNQYEIVVPLHSSREPGEVWHSGIGDVAFGLKRVVFHSLASGTILSLAGEVILPTGDRDRGFGSGVTKFEPFVSFGQALPAEGFVHLQGGAEVSTDTDRADHEAFWRGAIGTTFTEGRFGRAWSPMIEVLGARELVSGATTDWDIVPQFHVTLNTRQHVMANLAVRIPLTDTGERQTRILAFLLLDWFDGPIQAGW